MPFASRRVQLNKVKSINRMTMKKDIRFILGLFVALFGLLLASCTSSYSSRQQSDEVATSIMAVNHCEVATGSVFLPFVSLNAIAPSEMDSNPYSQRIGFISLIDSENALIAKPSHVMGRAPPITSGLIYNS